MNIKLPWLIILLVSVSLCSCSKDKDEQKPTIVVHSPGNLTQVNGLDTLLVSATISDDNIIESVSVSLRNKDDIPVLSSVSKRPKTKTYELNIDYFFDDLQLASGTYDLAITASDGENTKTAYTSILYNETNRVKQGTFIVSNSPSISSISYLDTNYIGSFYVSVSGDFLGLEVNSAEQELIYASAKTGSFSSRNLPDKQISWSHTIQNPLPSLYYTSIYNDGQTIYLAKRSGGIFGYHANGNPSFSTPVNSAYFTEEMHIHNDQYFISEERSLTGGANDRLVLYWMYSGSIHQQTALSDDVKGIFSKDNNTVVLLSNDVALNGKVSFYEISSSFITSPFSLNIGAITDCLEVGVGVYLVVEAGNLTLINVNNFSKTAYIPNVGAEKIWYDDLTGELYVTSGNDLSVYDFSSKALKGSYTHTSEIKDIAFWYNK